MSATVVEPSSRLQFQLEHRWRELVAEITELAVEYHRYDDEENSDGAERWTLLRKLVYARQSLRNVESALDHARTGCVMCAKE